MYQNIPIGSPMSESGIIFALFYSITGNINMRINFLYYQMETLQKPIFQSFHNQATGMSQHGE